MCAFIFIFKHISTGGVSSIVGGAVAVPTFRFAPITSCFATPTFIKASDILALKWWCLTLAMQNYHICRQCRHSGNQVNPRPVGLWWDSHSVGGRIPPWSPKTTGPISKIQTPFDSPVRDLSKHVVKFGLEVTDDVTGQVGLVISASTISMLSANKANESTWIFLLTFVSII